MKSIVCATFTVVMLFATAAAALHVPLPDCFAVTVHVPAAFTVNAVPDTVQTVDGDDVNVTASPDDAVAARVNGDSDRPREVGGLNVIVCAAFVTVMTFATDEAGAHVPSPACAAVTVHFPAPVTVRAVPDTVQTVDGDDVNVTASPDKEVAARVSGD